MTSTLPFAQKVQSDCLYVANGVYIGLQIHTPYGTFHWAKLSGITHRPGVQEFSFPSRGTHFTSLNMIHLETGLNAQDPVSTVQVGKRLGKSTSDRFSFQAQPGMQNMKGFERQDYWKGSFCGFKLEIILLHSQLIKQILITKCIYVTSHIIAIYFKCVFKWWIKHTRRAKSISFIEPQIQRS